MRLLALLLALGQAPTPEVTPNVAFTAATLDLTQNVRPEKRPFTRYLSLHGVPKDDRPAFLNAIHFTLNSCSFASNLVKFPVVGGMLLRIDLEELGWDRFTRSEDLEKLRQLGVTFKFADTALEKRFVDIWEDIAALDPYFREPSEASGKYARGWIEPTLGLAARTASQSGHPVVRADWLLTRLMLESQDGGFYSQTLLLPTSEGDLYKRLGADIKFIDLQSQTRHGAAIVGPSAVARHNRELQLIPGAFGYIWRTFDFEKVGFAQANVLLTLGGKVKHQGREIIFRLPNGLQGYYLSNGAGAQTNVVPQAIALDLRKTSSHPISDRNVTTSWKCVSCHGPVSGIWPFTDAVKVAALADGTVLAVLSKDKRTVTTTSRDLREYYLTDLDSVVVQQQADYAASVQSLTTLDPGANADGFIVSFDRYFWNVVTPEQAALEMGETIARAKDLWLVAGNPLLALLRIGQPIRREDWEITFPDAMRAQIQFWEQPAKAVPVAKPAY